MTTSWTVSPWNTFFREGGCRDLNLGLTWTDTYLHKYLWNKISSFHSISFFPTLPPLLSYLLLFSLPACSSRSPFFPPSLYSLFSLFLSFFFSLFSLNISRRIYGRVILNSSQYNSFRLKLEPLLYLLLSITYFSLKDCLHLRTYFSIRQGCKSIWRWSSEGKTAVVDCFFHLLFCNIRAKKNWR